MFAGSVSVLPTILFLTTGVVKELAAKNSERVSPVVAVALQCLKVLCTSPLLKESTCSSVWKQHLQSALATVLDFCKPGSVMVQFLPIMSLCNYRVNFIVFILWLFIDMLRAVILCDYVYPVLLLLSLYTNGFVVIVALYYDFCHVLYSFVFREHRYECFIVPSRAHL